MTDKISDKISTPILLMVAAILIVGIMGYHILSKSRYGMVVGIVYSDEPSAVVDREIVHEGNTIHGVKVVKIHKDKVEFESKWNRWTQRVEEQPSLSWPEVGLN